MKSQICLLAHLTSLVLAAGVNTNTGSFVSYVNTVGMELSELRAKVVAWTSSQGLSAALGIQSSYPGLMRAITALRTASQTVTSADIEPDQMIELIDAISSLLSAMNEKQSDFRRVGARAISTADIRDLEQPTIDIVNAIVRGLSSDCTKLGQLAPYARQLAASFASSERLFGIQAHQFPEITPCQNFQQHHQRRPIEASDRHVPVHSRPVQPPIVSTHAEVHRASQVPTSFNQSNGEPGKKLAGQSNMARRAANDEKHISNATINFASHSKHAAANVAILCGAALLL